MNGPVLFSKKVTSTSDEGIEAASFKIQGDATISRKYTVGIATPTTAGNAGDVVYNSDPVKDGYIGWVYTTDNGWYPFGNISIGQNSLDFTFDKAGIGTGSYGDNTFQVGSGTSIFSVDADYGVGIGSTSCLYKLNVNGNTNINGVITATNFVGDGSLLTSLPSDCLWTYVGAADSGIFPLNQLNVGIGTSVGTTATLTVGSDYAPSGGFTTSLMVHHRSHFLGTADFGYDVNVSGITTLANFDLDNTTNGRIVCGVATVGILTVGTGGTTLATVDEKIGLGTATPRAKIDLEGPTRMSSYHEIPKAVTSSSGVVTLELDQHQTFTITTSEAITQFTLQGVTADSSSTFTIKILQGDDGNGSGYAVGIDTFKNSGGSAIPVYWPGGVVPTVTATAAKTDIYSFMTFDGGSSLFGIVGGQNFS